MYFKELAKVAAEKINKKLFDESKTEIINELSDKKKFVFEDDTEINLMKKNLNQLKLKIYF